VEEGLELPARRWNGSRWETYWHRPNYRTIVNILTNPAYAGAYSFGKTALGKRVVNGVVHKTSTRKPMGEWGVLIREHHQGCISWAEFEKIQNMLKQNASSFRAGGLVAAKRGPALLAGLLRCRRCGWLSQNAIDWFWHCR
jgi:hypothetical protein